MRQARERTAKSAREGPNMAAAMPPPPPAPPLMRKESSTYTYELRGLFSGEEDAYVSASDKVIAKVAELAAADQYHKPDGQVSESWEGGARGLPRDRFNHAYE